jgi:hypothetical protein
MRHVYEVCDVALWSRTVRVRLQGWDEAADRGDGVAFAVERLDGDNDLELATILKAPA